MMKSLPILLFINLLVLYYTSAFSVIPCNIRTARNVSDVFGKINKAIDDFVGNVTVEVTPNTPPSTNDIDTNFNNKNQEILKKYDEGLITKERLNLELSMNRYEYQQARNDKLTGRTQNVS